MDRYSVRNYYVVSDGAPDGLHYDMFSFKFNDFPDWVYLKKCKIIRVNDMEANTPDLISFLYYGDETMYWLICLANKIVDPFEELPMGKLIFIPNISVVNDYILSLEKTESESSSSSNNSKNKIVSLN